MERVRTVASFLYLISVFNVWPVFSIEKPLTHCIQFPILSLFYSHFVISSDAVYRVQLTKIIAKKINSLFEVTVAKMLATYNMRVSLKRRLAKYEMFCMLLRKRLIAWRCKMTR